MDEKKLQRLEKIFEAANDDVLSTSEMAEIFDTLLKTLKDYKEHLEEGMKETSENMSKENEAMCHRIDSMISTYEKAHDEHQKQMMMGIKKDIQRIEGLIPEIPKFPEFPEIPDIKPLEKRIKTIEDKPAIEEITGDKIVDKINDLSIDPEKQIDFEHIKNWKKIISEYVKNNSKNNVIMGGTAGRDLFKDIDISSQLDGITKTFNIPATWNIISVHASSFPHALRKTIDYTYTSTTITFTDQINAGTTLASGQTVILTVVTG